MSESCRAHESPSSSGSGLTARRLFAGLVAWFLALVATNVPALTLAEYEHTSWGLREGVAPGVTWAREVPNGMLLLKTSIGYQVFDGVEFHSFERGKPPPLADVAGALGQRSPTGAIYFIDPVTQTLVRQWNGRTDAVEDKDDFVRFSAAGPLAFDPAGIGWLSYSSKLFRLDGLKVELIGASWGLPAVEKSKVLVDARGTVWVCIVERGDGVLYYLPRGARKFERFADPVACFPMAQAPDGSLWCANEWGVAVVTLADGRPVSRRFVSKTPTSFIEFDSRGGFWAAGRFGLAHLSDWRVLLGRDGEAALDADRMTPKDGLSSDGIWWIEEDSAGNVWVATGAGLDRFRATFFTPMKLPRRGWGAVITADADGSLWAGNYDRNLMHISGGRIEDVPGITHTTGIGQDATGGIWVAGQHGVWRKKPGGTFAQVDGPPLSSMPEFRQIAEDDSGAMWFESYDLIIRLREGVWSRAGGPDVPPLDQFYFMLADQQQRLWFAGNKHGAYFLKNGTLREIKSPAYAAAVDRAYSGFARGQRVWIGGAKGVGAFVGEEFHPLQLTDDAARSITGIVETADGDLWLHGLAKAFRITRARVEAGLNGQIVTPEVFDFHDGLRASTSPLEPKPTLVQDAAGRLWFATSQGLYWIDPHEKRKAGAPPPRTLLRAVRSNGRLIPLGSVVVLPPNPGPTEFSYVAAALGVSDRVRFRYRLEGIDEEWREAGTRRTAYYTQLPPGRHRFEVVASNEQGRWADSPTRLDFEVQAAWYQTAWFRAAVVVLSIGLLWLVYLLRVGVVASRERARMRAIAAERERIARDLHDTLLQSLQGVILGFHALAISLPPRDETRHLLEGRLDHAEQLLGEARDRVRDLRSAESESVGLRQAFEAAAAELVETAQVDVVEEGKPRELRFFARESIYLIGREALLNAVTHGKGTHIELRLQSTSRHLVLQVRDNGIGFDPDVLATASRPGHYGLVGMRERAGQLGAELTLGRAPGGGAEVVLDVPAARAFEEGVNAVPWFGLRSKVEDWWRRSFRSFGKRNEPGST